MCGVQGSLVMHGNAGPQRQRYMNKVVSNITSPLPYLRDTHQPVDACDGLGVVHGVPRHLKQAGIHFMERSLWCLTDPSRSGMNLTLVEWVRELAGLLVCLSLSCSSWKPGGRVWYSRQR